MVPVYDGHGTVDTFVRVEGSPQARAASRTHPATITHMQSSETVLLVPDPLSSSFMFRHVIPLLVAKDLRVVAFDFPGTGHSRHAPPHSHTTAYRAEFIAHVTEALQLRATHVVGHGVGARAALDYAMSYPKRVRSLTVVGAGPDGRAAILPHTTLPILPWPLMDAVLGATFLLLGAPRSIQDTVNYAFFLTHAGVNQ